MTCIVVTILPETARLPVRVRAKTRDHTITVAYQWILPARLNAVKAAMKFREFFYPNKELGLCKELGRSKYKFPILA